MSERSGFIPIADRTVIIVTIIAISVALFVVPGFYNLAGTFIGLALIFTLHASDTKRDYNLMQTLSFALAWALAALLVVGLFLINPYIYFRDNNGELVPDPYMNTPVEFLRNVPLIQNTIPERNKAAINRPQGYKEQQQDALKQEVANIAQGIFVGAVAILVFGCRIYFRRKSEKQTKNQEELQAYTDKMSDYLSYGKLRESFPGDAVRKSAQESTFTVLSHLDEECKGSALRFLYEFGLIERNNPIIKLNGANLSGANPKSPNLSSADLSGADLSGADLMGINLTEANLNGANLKGAIYNSATIQLKGKHRKTIILNPTQWPHGFDPKTAGAIEKHPLRSNGSNLQGTTVLSHSKPKQ